MDGEQNLRQQAFRHDRPERTRVEIVAINRRDFLTEEHAVMLPPRSSPQSARGSAPTDRSRRSG